ncbi:putative GNAT family N-acetyltransferase [Candidatus Hepatincolaceae symbiont of Richtersius coronifer]
MGAYSNHIVVTNTPEKIYERLELCFNKELVTSLHRSTFLVAKENELVVGSVSAYPGSLIPYYNENMSKIIDSYNEDEYKVASIKQSLSLEKEANADEYYIDTLSVNPKFRGRGIAEKLIKSIVSKAKSEGFNKISLVVDPKKEKAIKYYKKLGFEFDGLRYLGGMNYHHMVKQI